MLRLFKFSVVSLSVCWLITITLAYNTINAAEIHRIRRQAEEAGKEGCRLPPPLQNGRNRFSGRRCPPNGTNPVCQMTEGNMVPHNWPIYFSCDPGYNLSSTTASVCLDGQWIPTPSICIRLCSPLRSSKVDLKCVYSGQKVSCDKDMRPGTVISAMCKSFYRTSFQMTCQNDGSWAKVNRPSYLVPEYSNRLEFDCVPECGLSSEDKSSGKSTQISTNVTSSSVFPWLAGIYIRRENKYRMICAGSLITARFVLTDADCIRDSGWSNRTHLLKVGLGKIHRRFYNSESHSEVIEVGEVVFVSPDSTLLSGIQIPSGWKTLDVALLRLLLDAHVSAYIMPVCLDWSYNYFPSNGSMITVSGWSEDVQTVERGNLRVQLLNCSVLPFKNVKSLRSDTCLVPQQMKDQLYPDVTGSGATYEVEGRHFLMAYYKSRPNLMRNKCRMMILHNFIFEEISNTLRNISSKEDII